MRVRPPVTVCEPDEDSLGVDVPEAVPAALPLDVALALDAGEPDDEDVPVLVRLGDAVGEAVADAVPLEAWDALELCVELGVTVDVDDGVVVAVLVTICEPDNDTVSVDEAEGVLDVL